MSDVLYIIVPCYNEEEALPETARQLRKKLCEMKASGSIHKNSKILFVDDGSSDGTWILIQNFFKEDPNNVAGYKLTRNRGHQNALWAGLMECKEQADITISIDADLQDDINAMDAMLAKYQEGYQVVYGVRSDRSSDTKFKRNTAQWYYKLMKFLGVELVYNHADYRLMSKAAVESLSEFSEVNLFLRGMVPLVGYPSTTVEYKRTPRLAGKSKYKLRHMMELAWEGITSFSVQPLRLIGVFGVLVLLLTFGILIYTIVGKIVGFTVRGWSSLIVSLWFLGGVQMLSLSILGEYIGKIYKETKKRPPYLIETRLDQNQENQAEK